MERWQSGRLYL